MVRSSVSFLSVFLLVTPTLLLGPLGCARGQSAQDRQMAELRDDLAKVQSESDRFEQRLDKLEVDTADGRTDLRTSEAAPAHTLSTPIATPPLRVVRIGADGMEETGAAGETAGSIGGPDASDGPRIKIQASGGDASIITDKGVKRRTLEGPPNGSTSFTNVNLGPTLATHSASRPSALDEDAKRAYDAALALVNAKHYPEALDALAGFLVRWPDHPNADNAMYWRGESYFAQGEYTNAAQEFEGLLARFPLGNKASDALLKLGICEQHLGNAALAHQKFDRLRREFPHSEAVRRIPTEGAQSAQPVRSTSGGKP